MSDKLKDLEGYPMDIYTEPGAKVKFVSDTAGYPFHQETAKRHLTLGSTYTVKKMTVWDSSSEVELIEFPDVQFNTVLFANVPETMEMFLCEQDKVILKPDQPYLFKVDPTCQKCLELERIGKPAT